MLTRITTFDTWVDRARIMPIEGEVDRRGFKLKGRAERVGPCPICGGTNRFSINTLKQVFNCRGCGKGGDVIDLVQHIDCCDFLSAVETLTGEKRPNGNDGAQIDPERKRERAEQRERHAPEQEQRNEQERQDAARQRDKAQWLCRTSEPAAGSIVERYLRQCRRITAPPPATVRFLPARAPSQHPAMLVPYGIPSEPEPGTLVITEPVITAVHLTLLKPDGTGKADTAPNKITVGSPAGRPLVLAPFNDAMGLAITEGIEDALTVHEATGLGAWAAGSAGYMPRLVAAIEHLAGREYDASPDCITVFVDDDPAGRRNACALAVALAKLSARLAAATMPRSTTHFEILLREAAA
jgi:putative DNA primase/helicase